MHELVQTPVGPAIGMQQPLGEKQLIEPGQLTPLSDMSQPPAPPLPELLLLLELVPLPPVPPLPELEELEELELPPPVPPEPVGQQSEHPGQISPESHVPLPQ